MKVDPWIDRIMDDIVEWLISLVSAASLTLVSVWLAVYVLGDGDMDRFLNWVLK